MATDASKPFLVAQGDVLIRGLDRLPEKLQPVETGGFAVLAHGEATGHHHAIRSNRVAMFREDGAGGGLYLQVSGSEPVSLEHQEHAAIAIPPGLYAVVRQREWSDEQESRRVAD